MWKLPHRPIGNHLPEMTFRNEPHALGNSSDRVTFLFCVESGYIEGQIIVAIECLRRFGGALAQAPILVVTPRFGPSLTRSTLIKLDELRATYVRRNLRNPWDWYVYTNKAMAAFLGEELVHTEQIVWLDSDVLVVSEPQELILKPSEDFACCSVDKNVGSSGPGDPYESYWAALASYYGLSVDMLPWVKPEQSRSRVRFRLHSGVYSFRCRKQFGRAFLLDLESMLNSRIAFSRDLPYPGDDVAMAFTVIQLNLNWRLLPLAYNYEMTPTSELYERHAASHAKILHYHHALSSADGARWFIRELQTFRPDVADWLRPRVPLLKRTGGFHRTIMRRLLREARDRRWAEHLATCKITVVE